MKQYFNVKTGKEVLLNKPFSLSVKDDECTTTFEVTSLSESLADMLVRGGILSTEKPILIPTDIAFYVCKLAKKLKITPEACRSMLASLEDYSPATVFSLLSKQIALELDSHYEGHISKSESLYGVELTRGCIVKLGIGEGQTLRNLAVYRTREDAVLAINILKPFYDRMFE